MKLKELNEAIAAACNVRANVVSQVQNETFRALRAAIDKGEKVVVPEFGIFLVKDVPGEEGAPERKSCASRPAAATRTTRKKEKREKKGKAAGAEGKGAAAGPDESGDED